MLNIKDLHKNFRANKVLSGVNLNLGAGEVVGLIGRSGAGKSTLARCLVGLEKPDAGQIKLNGAPIDPGKGIARQNIQYLWQDPTQSLSPFLSARAAVLETLNGFGIGPAATRPAKAEALLAGLGLGEKYWHKRPHALSGGQCQRVAMARALAADSPVLILDEPLSSLDLATQIATMKMLGDIHAQRGNTMLIVSHDLAPLRRLADRIAVLDEGRIVDDLAMSDFDDLARHPLSRAHIHLHAQTPDMGQLPPVA